MFKRSLFVKMLLLAVLVWALVGCGGNDETPPAGNTSQTKALVPDSVVHAEEAEVSESDPVELPISEEAPAAVPEPPVETEPAPVVVEAPAPVSAEKFKSPVSATADAGIFSLQLGAYTVAAQAEEKAAQLRELGYPGTVEQAVVGGQLYHRVFIRGLSDRESAEKLGEELLSSLGLSYLIRRK